MSVKFGSVKGYLFLDVWVLANIIQVSTYNFCKSFLNKSNDPAGRMFDQMTMAARSCTANIAEGVSRHQTSRETELKLLDVARASLSELLGDYTFWCLVSKYPVWSRTSEQYVWVSNLQLNKPRYTDDWVKEAYEHILKEYDRFKPAIENEKPEVVINAMIILCNRTISMLERMMKALLEKFKESGGFTENMSETRVKAQVEKSIKEGSPNCPICGKPMIQKIRKKGAQAGSKFWSCSQYPSCNGTRNL